MPQVVAEIALYGNGPQGCGAGYIVALPGGRMLGTGEPEKGWTFTQAIFSALNDLQDAGVNEGMVAIYEAGGERVAFARLQRDPFYYEQLLWHIAPVFTISAEAIKLAAKKEGA